MYIDEALENVMTELNGVLIPASESEKMENVKGGIRKVIISVRSAREQAAKAAKEAEKKEEKADED